MPYVPSRKTVPSAEDREVLNPIVESLSRSVAAEITNNFSLRKIYSRVFVRVAECLALLLKNPTTWVAGELQELERKLAKAIYELGAKYGYEGAYLGEFNYAFTRFIQLVPQYKVGRGDWQEKDELRYWLYAETVSALRYAQNYTENLDVGVDGVFEDIKDEYKWEVNRSYEIAQILKSGHCYIAPFYCRPIELRDEEDESHVGYIEVHMRRSDETLNIDILPHILYVRRKKNTRWGMVWNKIRRLLWQNQN